MDDDKLLLDGDELPRISTGNAGLDDILEGGIDLRNKNKNIPNVINA